MSKRMPINVMTQGLKGSRIQSAIPKNNSIRNSAEGGFLLINKYGT
jgi:hypothetical protein